MLDIKLKTVDLQVELVFGVTNLMDGQEEIGIMEIFGMRQQKKACMDVFQMKISRGTAGQTAVDTRICGFGQMEDSLIIGQVLQSSDQCLIIGQVLHHQAPVTGRIVLMLPNVIT